MNIALCATRNMYPQLQQMITLLMQTQSSPFHIYAFVEDDVTTTHPEYLTFINVSQEQNINNNKVNGRTHWTYMTLVRCYFSRLLPDLDRILYLDLDLYIRGNLEELWNLDLGDKALAGVVDVGVRDHNLTYIDDFDSYINAGVLLMNLKVIRDKGLDKKIDRLLNTWPLAFPDQDALNLACEGNIICIDPKWNSSTSTTVVEDSIIDHCLKVKPWDPNSKYFAKWCSNYLQTGAAFSKY